MIIEAMKVMNEIPAPKDGVVTEILVSNEEMVEFGKGLVRIKWSIFKESKKLYPTAILCF